MHQPDQRIDQRCLIGKGKRVLDAPLILHQTLIVVLPAHHAQQPLDRAQQAVRQLRLGNVTGRAVPQRLRRNLAAAVCSHQHDGDHGVLGDHGLHKSQSVHLGHDQVCQNERGHVLLNLVQGFRPGLGKQNSDEWVLFQQPTHDLAVNGRIIDDQYPGEHRHGDYLACSGFNARDRRSLAGSRPAPCSWGRAGHEPMARRTAPAGGQ